MTQSIRVIPAFLLLFAGIHSLATENSIEGVYFSSKPVMAAYSSEEECTENRGQWQNESCFFEAEDEVVVTREKDSYRVQISTFGNNAHSCGFNGSGKLVKENVLIATEPTQEWDSTRKKLVNKTCRVEATFSKTGASVSSVSISASDECWSLCGAGAELNIGKAIKESP